MSNLLELADRCEAATGPDRELDVAVAFAIGRVRERDGNYLFATGNDSDMVVEPNAYDDHIVAQPLSYYTSSIDAAMTLAPEGWSVLSAWNGRDAICTVHLKPLGDPTGFWPPPGKAKSPALALCSAALRAMASAVTSNSRKDAT